jgi:hypothetical protein
MHNKGYRCIVFRLSQHQTVDSNLLGFRLRQTRRTIHRTPARTRTRESVPIADLPLLLKGYGFVQQSPLSATTTRSLSQPIADSTLIQATRIQTCGGHLRPDPTRRIPPSSLSRLPARRRIIASCSLPHFGMGCSRRRSVWQFKVLGRVLSNPA